MKKVFYPLAASLLLLTSAKLAFTPQDYKVKEGHSIAFKSKDPSGIFKDAKGSVKFDENDLENSLIDLTFKVNSISTGNGMMNKKAQTEEWFDADKHPEIKFESTKIAKSGDAFNVLGNLTIKGITKAKKVPMKVTKSGNDLVLTGTFGVNRIEYKIGKKSDAVPDVMNITYSIPVTKK
ncbi:MAG: YceI family protein [Crocinitomicaceae bacterium]|nr:YceI family protein [Crocinitomicaceae bacterium]